jgi:hypothetical protein
MAQGIGVFFILSRNSFFDGFFINNFLMFMRLYYTNEGKKSRFWQFTLKKERALFEKNCPLNRETSAKSFY